MLFAESDYPFIAENWKRINMRKVAHLAGAESLHNLYNRHWPRINSLRFRHTITNYKDGTVESFAPNDEWRYMQHWLSKKFSSLDTVLIREIEAILTPTYDLIDELTNRIDKTNLEELSPQELALLFIDIMDYPLGEIYRLNVVQIEYSLNYALQGILEEYEPSAEDRNVLLSKLIAPGELTVAQEEEIRFAALVRKGQKLGAATPKMSSQVYGAFLKHVENYAPKHCAYGELPPTEQDYVEKYVRLYASDAPPLTKARAQDNINRQVEESQAILRRIGDTRLERLCNLMARIGVFRDQNKAKLGETVVRRLRIMDAIARRARVSRQDLDHYLISEIVTLLDTGKKLPVSTLKTRAKNGVCFERAEDMTSGTRPLQTTQKNNGESKSIRGICASGGYIKGHVKIIHSKNDKKKMNDGDIMVAVGTDFDLIEIMHMSSGIITEEGGLLSHASVVSRELKKPCLIGIEGATSMLQDGDFVVLDANNGFLELVQP